MTIGTTVKADDLKLATAHFAEVGGYLSKRAAEVLLLINSFQRHQKISGHILEIGAYEGRSTIFFTHLISDEEVLHVSDLFDRQDLNVSHSVGVGYRPWDRNVKRFKQAGALIEVHRGPSQELDAGKLGGDFRIAYLDGGHSTDEVISDLRLADEILLAGGVAILDDTFRDDFPGTTEGLVTFVNEKRGDLAPVLCFETKVALVRSELHTRYMKMFTQRTDTDESSFLPLQRLCGWEVLTIRFRGEWEMASLHFRDRFPRLHSALSARPLIGRLFHKARGGIPPT